jgi:hypothetical protein
LSEDDFDYYLRASVDLVVVSTTTCLPLIAIELDSARHETSASRNGMSTRTGFSPPAASRSCVVSDRSLTPYRGEPAGAKMVST